MNSRVGIAVLILFAFTGVAVYGWFAHWNAYTNLSLTLGDVVLWIVLFVAVGGSRRLIRWRTC